jgi:hypothetical protein
MPGALLLRAEHPTEDETVATNDSILWLDDYRATFDGTIGEPGPDGRTAEYTLAALLEDEADEFERTGDEFGRVVGRALRFMAADARRRGIMRASEYLVRTPAPFN